MAGLNRLNNTHVAQSAIDTDAFLPAVVQGAIGIERRETVTNMQSILAAINDDDTSKRLAAERAFLKALDGSCQTPIAGLATLNGDQLTLQGQILKIDGTDQVSSQISGLISDGAALGETLAKELLKKSGGNFF